MLRFYRLRENVACCRFDTCTVVLDITADRYWMISGGAAAALAWVDGSLATPVHPDQIERLLALRLIESAPSYSIAQRVRLIQVATSADMSGPAEPFSVLRAAEVAFWSAAAWFGLRVYRLERLIAIIKKRRRRSKPDRRMAIEALAREFRRYRSFVPLARVCLPDSLAFLAFAARRGHCPRLVFGVIAHPFAAHCWVQQDDIALTDSLDNVGSFSPILVI